MDSVGSRVQGLPIGDQVLALSCLAASRSGGVATAAGVEDLFLQFALPGPSGRMRDVFAALRRKGLVTPGQKAGEWLVTPVGKATSENSVTSMDLAVLLAEAEVTGTHIGAAAHPVLLPQFGAPPSLLPVLREFLAKFEFDRNVFGMTRFPSADEQDDAPDPVKGALAVAKEVCEQHGLFFHLASDRQMHDDLWTNVAAHMWACKYGVALFEDLADPKRGLNYNLTIEVGSMLITGRRCALLKDPSVEKLPTDLIGQLHKPLALAKDAAVRKVLHLWIRDDLGLGSCPFCPS